MVICWRRSQVWENKTQNVLLTEPKSVCVSYGIFCGIRSSIARTNAAFIISLLLSLAVFLGHEQAPSPDQRGGTVYSVCTLSGHFIDWLRFIHQNRFWIQPHEPSSIIFYKSEHLKCTFMFKWVLKSEKCCKEFCASHPATALLTFVCFCIFFLWLSIR